MLYIKSKNDTTVYMNWGLNKVWAGETIGVPASTYFVLQGNANFEPVSSKFTSGTHIYSLVASGEGTVAVNGWYVDYVKWDIIEVRREFVNSLILKWFTGLNLVKEEVKEEIKEEVKEEIEEETTEVQQEEKTVKQTRKRKSSK